jgi:UDP-GlcNAc3NAcA epimerase
LKKIIAIVGARPQFIKHAPVLLALKKYFKVETIHTGQHYDDNMSRIFFDELGISKPEYQLSWNQTDGIDPIDSMTKSIELILKVNRPDFVLVYGDTNSTLAGAKAASRIGVKLIHVEAGLRSFNLSMPEERNRIETDRLSSILFCPSEESVRNLQQEGITNQVYICGDVMKDMLQLALPFLQNMHEGDDYVYATLHRPYNVDDRDRMSAIIQALAGTGRKVIFPIHPRSLDKVKSFGIQMENYPNIKCIDPVGYFDSLSYQKYANCIITDSGGIQKEAYWLRKKCITIRPETEWVETLEGGWNKLLFDHLEELSFLLQEDIPDIYDDEMYGNGQAAEKILNVLQAIC